MTIDEATSHAREVASRMFDDRVHCIKCAEEHEQLAEWLEELKQYRAIGTPEECLEAMEKYTAKKPMHVTNSYFGYQKHKEHVGYCPDCGHQVEEPYGCPNCLRKIDWSDEE